VLAYHALASLFAAGCAVVITTVVDEPVRNLASRPLLAAVGALQVGSIAEHYEDVGAITSDVFMVPRAALDPEAQTDDPRAQRPTVASQPRRQLARNALKARRAGHHDSPGVRALVSPCERRPHARPRRNRADGHAASPMLSALRAILEYLQTVPGSRSGCCSLAC
jgi:hypothetical protein